MDNLSSRLQSFQNSHKFLNKGPLSVALHITRLARENGLPLSYDDLKTERQGQVKGLGIARVQAILSDYGISRILAKEGGRTSRGSLGNSKIYIDFLNQLNSENCADLDFIEQWWIEQVKEYFASKPFILKIHPAYAFHTIIEDLFAQARARQKANPGIAYAGSLLQYIVGAKLDIVMDGTIEHFGANAADGPTGRSGDYVINDAAIHITTMPTDALILKCAANIEAGLRPIIITTSEAKAGAISLAKSAELNEVITILDAEQFVASNLHEWGKFSRIEEGARIMELIKRYNQIVRDNDTDLSLLIKASSGLDQTP